MTALLVGSSSLGASGADFRVENRVFVGSQKKPVAQSTTIFHGGIVYDYLAEPAEVTVFDPARGRFVLLDVMRKIKTELTTETLEKAIGSLKKRAQSEEDPYTQFVHNPSFERQLDESSGEVTFDSDWMTYRVLGTAPAKPELAHQYREFSDAYASLNTFVRPGSRPPFARLIVNEAVEKRGEIPKRVDLRVTLSKGFPPKRISLHSEHHLILQLVESDRRRVAQTGQFLAMFNTVSYGDYEKKPEE